MPEPLTEPQPTPDCPARAGSGPSAGAPDPAPRFDLAGFLPYQLAVAATRVSRAFAARYRREFGLSIPEWRILAHLAAGGTVGMREIQARVDMDKSRVSRAAARLEAAGLIAKTGNAADRRSVDLRLTAAGAALVARIVPVAEGFHAELLARLGSEATAFRRGLARLLAEDDGAEPAVARPGAPAGEART